MGLHSKKCVQAYRKKQKDRKKEKLRSILQTGNTICNVGFSAHSSESSCVISGVWPLSMQSESSNEKASPTPETNESHEEISDNAKECKIKSCVKRDLSGKHCKTILLKQHSVENSTQIGACVKRPIAPNKKPLSISKSSHLALSTDPLWLKYQEYKLLKRRINQIETATHI